MAVIPPWLNVSPSDFLRAMQAGAGAGLQVAQLRQSGNLEQARLAQSAAEAAAARSAAAQARAENLAFQQWERGELARQAAEENARQERVAMAGLEERGRLAEAQLGQRSLEAALRSQTELSKGRETERHQRAMEETARGRLELGKSKLEADLNRLKARLDVPTRYHLTTVQGQVIATDPITGKSFVAWPKQEEITPGAPTVSVDTGSLPTPFDIKNLDPRLIQGPFGGAPILGPFSFPGQNQIPAPSPERRVKRYLFRGGNLVEAD